MNKYKISIIIPAYNLEDKINRAFNSIKNQTIGFENIEVLIVDDNSTDTTFNIINDFANAYENVLIFQTDVNSEYAGKPRNIGLENASSDYVLFLDGDDELLINSCEVLYDKITSTDSDIVVGGQINVFEGIPEYNPPLVYGKERIFKNMANYEPLNIRPAISAKLFKRELLMDKNIRFIEGIAGQDLVFLMNAFLESKQIITLNDFYVYYRIISDSSVSFDISEKYLKGLIKSYTMVCDLFDEHEVPLSIQEKAIQQHISFLTSQTIRTNIESNREMLNELYNSELFNTLSNKDVFKNNENYVEYFNKMRNGKYENEKLLSRIKNNFGEDEELKILNEQLYDANIALNRECENLNRSNIELENENLYLKKDNNILKEENNDLKSSTLWKLKNKF